MTPKNEYEWWARPIPTHTLGSFGAAPRRRSERFSRYMLRAGLDPNGCGIVGSGVSVGSELAMAFHIPDDPFLKDAEGSARFCRDLLARMTRPKLRGVDFGPAIRWSAICAAHWAVRSKTWAISQEYEPCDACANNGGLTICRCWIFVRFLDGVDRVYSGKHGVGDVRGFLLADRDLACFRGSGSTGRDDVQNVLFLLGW